MGGFWLEHPLYRCYTTGVDPSRGKDSLLSSWFWKMLKMPLKKQLPMRCILQNTKPLWAYASTGTEILLAVITMESLMLWVNYDVVGGKGNSFVVSWDKYFWDLNFWLAPRACKSLAACVVESVVYIQTLGRNRRNCCFSPPVFITLWRLERSPQVHRKSLALSLSSLSWFVIRKQNQNPQKDRRPWTVFLKQAPTARAEGTDWQPVEGPSCRALVLCFCSQPLQRPGESGVGWGGG